MATLYIVLAVGVAVSVTVAGSLYALRGSQQRQLTNHSVTSAQAAAWRGAEVVRRYFLALDQATLAQWAAPAGLPLPATLSGLQPLGIPDGNARITAISGSGSGLQATVTLTAIAGSGSATTSATLEVVYDIGAGAGGSGGTPSCAAIPATPMLFNGNLSIGGGSLQVGNATGFEQIAVNGNIEQSSSSTAKISGCAKGDIRLSGGGIVSGGHLYAEGDITVNAMQNPSDTALWARNVTVGQGVSGGGYTAIKAGGYATNVFSGSTLIGTSVVGGHLLPATVSGGLPWRTGTLVPASGERIAIRLTGGDTYLLDLSKATIDSATGRVSGAAAAELLSGSAGAALPDVLSFVATGIEGGNASVATLGQENGAVGVKLFWGHTVSVTGWGGRYETLFANGDLYIVTGRIGRLVGGRDLIATQANQWSNFPTIDRGDIAGILRYGNGQQVPADAPAAPKTLRTRQAGTSPGLPGVPYCDTRVNRLDVATYRDAANYVFEWADNAPYLTIRNVRTASGASLDGTYNLASQDVRRLPGGGRPFLTCNWQQAGNDGAHCFRDKTAGNAWSVTGLTAFPRGVAWFDNALTINGVQLGDADGNRALINTLVAKGALTLTTSGSDKQLTAPNFSTPGLLCKGDFQPTNLCDTSAATPQFAEWIDAAGVTRRGLPIGNMALASEGSGSFGGWRIRGNVILGRALSNNADTTTITGSLTVGSNETGGNNTVGAGGIVVNVPEHEAQQYVPGLCTAPPATPGAPAAVSIRWSRYR